MAALTNVYMIGVDVSKDKLDIYWLPSNKHEQIPNEHQTILKWIEKINPASVQRIILEPTGGMKKS